MIQADVLKVISFSHRLQLRSSSAVDTKLPSWWVSPYILLAPSFCKFFFRRFRYLNQRANSFTAGQLPILQLPTIGSQLMEASLLVPLWLLAVSLLLRLPQTHMPLLLVTQLQLLSDCNSVNHGTELRHLSARLLPQSSSSVGQTPTTSPMCNTSTWPSPA